MDNTPHRSFPLTDRSYGAVLKRDVRLLAKQVGLSEKKIGQIDIIIAELTSNLVKYARDGEMLIRPIVSVTNPGIELISADSGPGMADTSRMKADGVSTGGSLGQGLGAVRRMADFFQLYSLPDWGTIVLVRLFQKPVEPLTRPLAAVETLLVPKPGGTISGDGFFWKLTTTSLKLFLGDGLGHGTLAQLAVQRAVQTVGQQQDHSPAAWLAAVHRATAGTRGLVGTAAVFDFDSRKWTLCGIGNIKTQLSGQQRTKSYAPGNGILGYTIPQLLPEQEMTYEPGQCLVMASDGIQTRWNPARYPNISRYDPMILAAAIYKEHARRTDDMSVMVAQIY